MVSIRSKIKSINKKALVAGVVVILVAVGGAYYLLYDSKSPEVENPGSSVKVDPPTKQEAAAGDQQKEEIVNRENLPQPTKANVILTDASQYGDIIEVRAYASNAYADGTCVINITNGGAKISKTVTAFRDATTTQCTTAEFSRSEFSQAGTWQVSVTYSGTNIKGETSSTLEIK